MLNVFRLFLTQTRVWTGIEMAGQMIQPGFNVYFTGEIAVNHTTMQMFFKKGLPANPPTPLTQ